MIVYMVGLALLFQASSIAGQGYQVYGSSGVQVIYPSSSQVQVLGGRPFFRRGLWELVRNLTITANSTSQDVQVVSPLGNGNIALSGNQNTGPVRTFIRNLFGRQPNVQYVTLNGRGFNDRYQEPQYNSMPQYNTQYDEQSFATPVILPRARVKVVRQGVPRRIMVQNLKSSRSQTTNVETYRIPVFENNWQYPDYLSARYL
ncbi:uncharacterized protein LOC108095108 [Drosophila ficusphila]|uniref:uncharacterized protein LOC108095108 n=1 Tax=Drosophila ficusphila TaxID=30025 RepID=UPI0007E7F327|nr:uncharacterized protein LOC108095108 [Drosophila ficusphila]